MKQTTSPSTAVEGPIESARGSIRPRRRLGCIAILIGSMACIALTGPPSDPNIKSNPLYQRYGSPAVIVTRLQTAGLTLEHPWGKSAYDGTWFALLRQRVAGHEINALLESRYSDTVQEASLEAEISKYTGSKEDSSSGAFTVAEQRALQAFAKACRMLCEEPGLFAAIESQTTWSGDCFALEIDQDSPGQDTFRLRFQAPRQ